VDALTDADRSMLLRELERARHGFGLAGDFSGEATRTSPSCGDTVTVRVGEGGFTWEGHGCAVSMAAASAIGALSIHEFVRLEPLYLAAVDGDGELSGDLEPFAGIGRFPLRGRCATLAWRAARAAIDEHAGDAANTY